MKKYSFVFWCGYVSNEDDEENTESEEIKWQVSN